MRLLARSGHEDIRHAIPGERERGRHAGEASADHHNVDPCCCCRHAQGVLVVSLDRGNPFGVDGAHDRVTL